MKNLNLFTVITVSVLLFFFTQIAKSQTCNEEEVIAVDDLKRTVENSLINARVVTTMLDSGTEITAFYTEGKLLKITSTTYQYNSEQIFFSEGHLRYYEISGYKKNKMFFYVYYFSDDKLFCKTNNNTGKPMKIKSGEEKKVIDIVEEYLLAIQ